MARRMVPTLGLRRASGAAAAVRSCLSSRCWNEGIIGWDEYGRVCGSYFVILSAAKDLIRIEQLAVFYSMQA